jgi:hypothetical protein
MAAALVPLGAIGGKVNDYYIRSYSNRVISNMVASLVPQCSGPLSQQNMAAALVPLGAIGGKEKEDKLTLFVYFIPPYSILLS